jgi:hypothetical protein
MAKDRIKARQTGIRSPRTKRPVFRILGEDGRTLARIEDARTQAQALSSFWMKTGLTRFSALLPADASPLSGHYAQMARSRRPITSVPPELALEGGTAHARAGRPKRAPSQDASPTAQEDLFAAPQGTASLGSPAREQHVPAEPPCVEEAAVTPLPPTRHLSPQDAPMTRVQHHTLNDTETADSYLYHVARSDEAQRILLSGLNFSPETPFPLTERPGVPYWLSALLDDEDADRDIAVLRVRRYLVESLIEIDPDATRSVGAACYFLTGGLVD